MSAYVEDAGSKRGGAFNSRRAALGGAFKGNKAFKGEDSRAASRGGVSKVYRTELFDCDTRAACSRVVEE